MVAAFDSVVAVGSSLEKTGALGGSTSRAEVVRSGPGGAATTKQKMLKMNERTHYVL